MAGQGVNNDNLSARAGDMLIADHILGNIISAFDQYIRAQRLYKGLRRVIRKQNNG